MSERITEAELRSFDPGPEPCSFDHGGFSYEEAHRLIEEIRRLRGLIVAATEKRDGEVALTMMTGWGEGETALMEEAQAIREGRG